MTDNTKQEALAVVEDAQAAANEIATIDVQDNSSYEVAAVILKQVKGQAKEIKAKRDAALAPLKAAMTEIKGWFEPALTYLEKGERHLKDQLSSHLAKVDEEQNKLLGEAERLDDAEEQIALIRQQDALSAPKVKGISTRETWGYEVTDIDAVPDEWKVLDQKGLAAQVRVTKEKTDIPGIRVFKKTTLAVRS